MNKRRIKVMSGLISIVFFLSVHMVIGQSNKAVKWYHIEKAQEMTKIESKPIFIDFTAEWCGWCKKMDKTTFMEGKVVDVLNEGFYAVKVDFDSRVPFEFRGKQYLAKELAKELGIEGLPTMIVVSADLKEHTSIVGYLKGRPFLAELERSK